MSPEENKPQKVSSICTECGAPLTFELGALQVRCEHCDAGLVVDKGQRLVRLCCPACAGNFYYLDGSMCGRCPYCDASLLAVSHDRLLRYVIRPVAERPGIGLASGCPWASYCARPSSQVTLEPTSQPQSSADTCQHGSTSSVAPSAASVRSAPGRIT